MSTLPNPEDTQMQWGNDQFGSDKDTYERGFRKTFRKAEHHKLTHGYGVIRDSNAQLKSVLKSIDNSMTASFVVPPGPKDENNQSIYYLAFVQCDSEELIRDVYLVGESGTFCFEQPEANIEPSGWDCHQATDQSIQLSRKPGLPNPSTKRRRSKTSSRFSARAKVAWKFMGGWGGREREGWDGEEEEGGKGGKRV